MRLSSTPLKIIPRISRMEKNRPHGRRQRHALVLAATSRPVSDNPAAPCPVPGPSPEPDSCRTLRQTGSVKGRRSRSRMTPKAPLTGSGCREHSNGGFGGGHPHFHPHATPTSNPRIKRQTQPAPKPSGSVRAFGVNRLVPLGWSEASSAIRRRCCSWHGGRPANGLQRDVEYSHTHWSRKGSGGRNDVLLCSPRVGRVKPSANSNRTRVAPSPRPTVVTAGVRPELPSLALPGTS